MTRLGLTVEPSSCPPHAPSGGLSFPEYRMVSRQSVHLLFVRSHSGKATMAAVYHACSPMISVAPCSFHSCPLRSHVFPVHCVLYVLFVHDSHYTRYVPSPSTHESPYTHHRRHDARLMPSWHILRSPSLLSGSHLTRLPILCASILPAHSHPRHHAHGHHHHPSERGCTTLVCSTRQKWTPHLPLTAQRLWSRRHTPLCMSRRSASTVGQVGLLLWQRCMA